MENNSLQKICYQTLLDLATEEGINASATNEAFGCVFGRDTAITVLKILKIRQRQPEGLDSARLVRISRQALAGLVFLQGKEFNLESGEEPGKFIHEYRKDKFEHLISGQTPWFVYPDGKLRNYDSVDSTPLSLIAINRYWQVTNDNGFISQALPAVENGLNWILNYGDRDGDHLLEYELSPGRKHGGLSVQSWTDSRESLRKFDGSLPPYPIAPVEVQGYAWLALKLWAEFFRKGDPKRATLLETNANLTKTAFNKKFIIFDKGFHFAAQALDGAKNQIKTITANPLLLLWSSYHHESVLEEKYIPDFVHRAFLPDLFDPDGGLRTMSTLSETYNPNQNSYHNGSFWPMLDGLVHEGLEIWGFRKEAAMLKQASLKGLNHFQTPIELYIRGADGNYYEYRNDSGRQGCKVQAWSAAAALDFLTE